MKLKLGRRNSKLFNYKLVYPAYDGAIFKVTSTEGTAYSAMYLDIYHPLKDAVQYLRNACFPGTP